MRGLLIATAVAGLAAPASSPPATSQPRPPSWSEPGPPSPSSQTGPWWAGSGQPAPSGGGGARAVRGGGWPSQGADRDPGSGAPGDGAPGGSTAGWNGAGGSPDRTSWGAAQTDGGATYRGSFARPRSTSLTPESHTYHGSRRGTAHSPSPTRTHVSHDGAAAAASQGEGGPAQPMR